MSVFSYSPPDSKRSRLTDQTEARPLIWSDAGTVLGSTVSMPAVSASNGQPSYGQDWMSLVYNRSNDRLLLLSATAGATGCNGLLTKWKGTADSGFHVVQTVEPHQGRGSLMCRTADGNVACAFDNGQ